MVGASKAFRRSVKRRWGRRTPYDGDDVEAAGHVVQVVLGEISLGEKRQLLAACVRLRPQLASLTPSAVRRVFTSTNAR